MTGPPKVGGARPGDALRLRLVPPRGSRQGVSRERAAVDFLEAGLEAANQFYFVIAIRVAAVAPHVLPQHFGGHSISSSVVKAPTFLDDMFEMFFHLRTTTRRRVAKLVCGVVLCCCGAVRRNRAAISPESAAPSVRRRHRRVRQRLPQNRHAGVELPASFSLGKGTSIPRHREDLPVALPHSSHRCWPNHASDGRPAWSSWLSLPSRESMCN